MSQAIDPFAQQSAPALSFKDAPIGTSYTGQVIDPPTMVHSRDFETGEPAFWPDGNPKKSVVTLLRVNGEERGLWAPKPSALFAALGEAQKQAGQLIAIGGTIKVTFTGEKPNAKNPRLNPQKQYAVTYTPPNALADTGTPSSSATQDAEPPF